MYATARIDAVPEDGRFRLEQHVDGDDDLSLVKFRFTGTSRTSADDLGVVAVARCVAGRSVLSSGRVSKVPTQPTLMLPGARIQNEMLDGEMRVVNLDAALFADFAGRRWGGDVNRFRPKLVGAASPVLAAHWNRFAAHLASDLLHSDSALENPIIRATTLEACAMTILAVFYEQPEQTRADDDGAMPSSVRRALQYIDDHASRPITVDDIAEAARVSARGLQSALRRHLGVTPMQRLRWVRLSSARDDLLAADPATTTVESVARRWGFANPGRFAGEYRREFGEPPSATLRK